MQEPLPGEQPAAAVVPPPEPEQAETAVSAAPLAREAEVPEVVWAPCAAAAEGPTSPQPNLLHFPPSVAAVQTWLSSVVVFVVRLCINDSGGKKDTRQLSMSNCL